MYRTAEGRGGCCWPGNCHPIGSLRWQLDPVSWCACWKLWSEDTWRGKKICEEGKTAYVAWKIEGAWLQVYSFWVISHILLIRVSEVHCQMSGSDLQSIPRWNWKPCISIWNSQRSKHTFLSPIWIMHECFFFSPIHTTNTWWTSKNSGRTKSFSRQEVA